MEGEAIPNVKPKWIPMSAKKVREAASLMGKGRPKAKPEAKGKGVKVSENLKDAWNDMYASDQPLCEEVVEEQYVVWCDDGQPGRDMVEASFLPSKYYVGSNIGWSFKTGVAGTGYYRDGVQYLHLDEQVPSMKGFNP